MSAFGLKISGLARRAGVSSKTIRFYEARGVLPPPARALNNYRLYDKEAVDIIRFIAALIHDARVRVGRPRYLEENGVDLSALRARIVALEQAGQTVVAVSRDQRLLGAIALGDRLREDARDAVRAMKEAGVTPVMVTGDNPGAARRVAEQLGIEEVYAGVLPGKKAAILRRLQAQRRVAMVGDGINDAPPLIQADVGIAMGAGTDIAIQSADIIIVGNRLTSLLTARDISRRSYGKTRQNMVLAFLFNGIGIPAAATGLVYPIWAMVEGPSLQSYVRRGASGVPVVPRLSARRRNCQHFANGNSARPARSSGCRIFASCTTETGNCRPRRQKNSSARSFRRSGIGPPGRDHLRARGAHEPPGPHRHPPLRHQGVPAGERSSGAGEALLHGVPPRASAR